MRVFIKVIVLNVKQPPQKYVHMQPLLENSYEVIVPQNYLYVSPPNKVGACIMITTA